MPPAPIYGKLDEKKRVVPATIEEIGILASSPSRKVGDIRIGPYRVSTVFLMINHGYDTNEDAWFETMVFSDTEKSEIRERYATYAEALRGHKRHCARLRRKLEKK